MSGICGIVALGGAIPTEKQIVAMTGAMARRGPDGQRHWSDGPAALGHALLATTPEALIEPLPLAVGEFTITADARLDNREELIGALGLTAAPGSIGDGELILRAYRKWGDDCPKHLLGDFAFAIWDAAAQKLFCARDHMGMRQLIYCHVPGQAFVFATDAEALFEHPAVPRRLNRGRVADFLIDLEGLDLTSTFYEQVVRLPPAHSLAIAGSRCLVRRYWQLRPGPTLPAMSAEEVASTFLALFTEAVRCRLRSPGPVGSMLSGGLDSSSVVAVAADLLAKAGDAPLQTFSVIGPVAAECPETEGIHAAAQIRGIDANFIDYTHLGPLHDQLARAMREMDEPFDGHMGLVRAVYLAAQAKQFKVVLDGVAGDVALFAGNRVAGLMREGRAIAAWREATGEAAFWKVPSHRGRAFLAAAWMAWAPFWLRVAKRRAHRAIADASLYRSAILRHDFVRETRLVHRRRSFRAHMQDRDLPLMEQRTQFVTHPHLTVGRERYDRVAAAVGIEPRDPFMDIRLIQFCLSVPASLIQDRGWPKMLLRRAMFGTLPEAVIWRPGKESLGWAFSTTMFASLDPWRSPSGSALTRLAEFVPDRTLRRLARNARIDDDRTSFDLHYLSLWLERFSREPLR